MNSKYSDHRSYPHRIYSKDSSENT